MRHVFTVECQRERGLLHNMSYQSRPVNDGRGSQGFICLYQVLRIPGFPEPSTSLPKWRVF